MKDTFGKPGPFQIVESEGADRPIAPPHRRYDCANYGTCLDLAASLNWDSFTCHSCDGAIDQRLLWRAHQAQKLDQVARKLCPIPELVCHQHDNPSEPPREKREVISAQQPPIIDPNSFLAELLSIKSERS